MSHASAAPDRATGVMPQVRNGIETDGAHYVSFGLTLTLGLGSAH